VSLRSESGELLGEALVTMRHGDIIISAEINPNTSFARKLMAAEGSFSIRTDEPPTTEIDYSVFEQ
ncbi:hypothetical protein, partial [Streptomyces sp. JV178]